MKSFHDLPGDGGSQVAAQVRDLHQRVARQLAGVRFRLAVGSGKGGVGKSTLALQLALALRRRGWEVAVLDADLNGPSQARLAGLRSVTPLPGERGLLLPRTPSGVRVLSLGSLLGETEPLEFDSVVGDESHTWRAPRERTLILDLLAGVDWGALDALVVDLPPGPERTRQYAELLGPGAAFVLVTAPSDLSRGVVARSARALQGTGVRVLGAVENMAGYWCAPCGEARPLFPRAGEVDLGLPVLASVPFDPALAEACDRGQDPESLSASPVRPALDGLAGRVIDLLEAP